MSMEERVNKYLSNLVVRLNIIIDDIEDSKYFDCELTNKYMDRLMIPVLFMCFYVLSIGFVLVFIPNVTLIATGSDTIAVYMAKQVTIYAIPVFVFVLIHLFLIAVTIVVGLYKYKPDFTK